MRTHTSLVLLAFVMSSPVWAQPVPVSPVAETQAVVRGGAAPQSVALWPNRGKPEQSLLLVADSVVGLMTFRLDGTEQQALLADGVMSGVDVRDDFGLPGGASPIIVVANGTLNALAAYIVDPLTLQLRRVDATNLNVAGFSPRTVTLYRSAVNGALYAFTSNATGTMRQIELRSTDAGVEGVPVRSFAVGGAIAGAVADDQQGYLFVVQPNTGIWRYDAEPDADDSRISVATAGDAPLTAPLGGVSLYALADGSGYLLAASAGGDQVAVLDRLPPHAIRGSFAVAQDSDAGTDAVTDPATVVAAARYLGPNFPAGLVAVHDEINDPMQNDKLVSWRTVANAFNPPLTAYQLPPDGGIIDGGTTKDGGGGGGTGGGDTLPGGDSGCGCSSAAVPGTLLFVFAALALRARRRQG